MWKFVNPAPFGLGTSESIRRIFSLSPSPRFIPSSTTSSSNVSHESERTRMRPQDYLPTATARKGNNDRRSTGEPGQLQLTQTTPKSRKKRGTTPTISENRFERVLHCAVKTRGRSEMYQSEKRLQQHSVKRTRDDDRAERRRFDNYLLNPVRSRE